MKKILGVSFAAMLAVSPMLANAETVSRTVTAINAATPTANTNIATTSYVKGAYKAAADKIDAIITDTAVTGENHTYVATGATVGSNLVALDEAIKDVAASNATTAGAGLSKSEQGAFSVNVDNTTVEISNNTLQVKDGGVTTAKIADANVTADKLATDSVTTAKIVNGAVTLGKIDSGAMVNTDNATYSNETLLTTQGYVDAAIAGVNNAAQNFADKDLSNLNPAGTAVITNVVTTSAAGANYSGATSGLTATTIQGAIDQVEARVDATETAIAAINNKVLPVYGTWDSDTATNTVTIGGLSAAPAPTTGE